MGNFSLSTNIETGESGCARYIVTPNVTRATGSIVRHFQSGIHSFCIIGTYGTGKSSFLLTLEQDMLKMGKEALLLRNPAALADVSGFTIINVVGEYASLEAQLDARLAKKSEGDSALDKLNNLYQKLKRQNKMLVIVIDEFGKALEHAAKGNPEKELYFLQQLAEYANAPQRNILLITSLHQNFGAYASRLCQAQRNEWVKVKGRFQEIVFAEPVEQLLYMAAETLHGKEATSDERAETLCLMAKDAHIAEMYIDAQTLRRLWPLDALAAIVLTRAIQRYGQNERSLFSFLNSHGEGSINKFAGTPDQTYNLSLVYDYIVENFHSSLQEANLDSMSWRAIIMAIDRVEAEPWGGDNMMAAAVRTVKAIGMLNIFGGAAFSMPQAVFAEYMRLAMGIRDADDVLKELLRLKIIRFAEYKKHLILYEGSDIDIEAEIAKAHAVVPQPTNLADGLRKYLSDYTVPAKECSYNKGTPRNFCYSLCNEPQDIAPTDEVDGYVELIFSTDEDIVRKVKEFSGSCSHAIVFAVFNEAGDIRTHLHNISIYDHIERTVLIDKSDKVALGEIAELKTYEESLLRQNLTEGLFSHGDSVTWLYHGDVVAIKKGKDFNVLLSRACEDAYPQAPTINNELINRHKLSSSISAARVKFLQALVANHQEEDLGFDKDKFPPEKTIYYTLLKTTGLHSENGFTDRPTDDSIMPLWEASEAFLQSTERAPRKVSDLIKTLSSQPYKVKSGVLDFWIPTYLFIKQFDYSLFGSDGSYLPNVNVEIFELLKRRPSDFSIKAYSEDAIRVNFFNQYRKLLNAEELKEIRGDKFIETVRPFFIFYNRLNFYAKNTRKFGSVMTLRFRDVLSKAKDPEKTFFEDLPEALGYGQGALRNENGISNYCQALKKALDELRSCYGALIDRIERQLIERLGLRSGDYSDYIIEIRQRLARVKEHLLTEQQRNFYKHAIAEFDDRQQWYQSICYAAIGQPLDHLRDEQEDILLDNLIFLFRECEQYSTVSEAMEYRVTEEERDRSHNLEAQIEALLSADRNLNIYALMNVLRKKMA